MAVRTRLAGVAAAVSLVVSAAFAATADAATGKLTISATGYGNQYYVIVAGDFSGYYPNGVDVAVRLMGDDEWFDDLLYAVPGSTYESPGSNHFGRELYVSGGTLNEDWGKDEIYGEARLYDHATGRLVQTIRTNVISGYFS
jgi:hypothetical protein